MSLDPGLGRRTLLLGAMAGLAGCAAYPSSSPVEVAVAGGESGSSFTKLARLLSGRLRERELIDTIDVRLTDGSSENLALLRDGTVQVAPALADAVATGPAGLVALARVSQLALHCLVRADGPLRDIRDLRGRRVSIGPEGSGTAGTAQRLLAAEGVVDVEVVYSGPVEAVISLAGGTIDAMLWWGGLPAAEIVSIERVEPLRALSTAGQVARLNAETAGAYRGVRLPGRVYGGGDVRTLGTTCLLMCREDLDDGLAAAIVDIVTDDGRLLVPQPADGVPYFAQAALVDTAPVPLHPGAAARYRERHG